jgi:hypothetical protein
MSHRVEQFLGAVTYDHYRTIAGQLLASSPADLSSGWSSGVTSSVCSRLASGMRYAPSRIVSTRAE